MRHALLSFLAALGVDDHSRDDVQTAVGEALANAVEHAYADGALGEIELYAQACDDGLLTVEVFDRGTFIDRAPRPGRGFGLHIARAIVDNLSITSENGTHVRMVFRVAAPGPFAANK